MAHNAVAKFLFAFVLDFILIMTTPQVQEMTPPQVDETITPQMQELMTQLRGMTRQQREMVWSEVTRRQREMTTATAAETLDRRRKKYEMYAMLLVILIIFLVYVIVAVVKDFKREDYILHGFKVLMVMWGLYELDTFIGHCQRESIWVLLGAFIGTVCLAGIVRIISHISS